MNMYKGEFATAAESSIDQQMIMVDWLNNGWIEYEFGLSTNQSNFYFNASSEFRTLIGY